MTSRHFDAEAYWASRPVKKWVVYLTKIRGYSKPVASDKKIVSSRTQAGACKTARFHCSLTGNVRAAARLATPTDLGIV